MVGYKAAGDYNPAEVEEGPAELGYKSVKVDYRPGTVAADRHRRLAAYDFGAAGWLPG